MVFHCALTIKSDTGYLAFVRQWVPAASRAAGVGVSKKGLIACNLALVEAVNNAIFHAHNNKAALKIGLSLRIDKARVVMDVVDAGKGLGRHLKIRPDSMATHGRGLFLIHKLMNRVESRMKNGRHILRMVYDL